MNNISNEIIYLHHLRTHPEFQEMVSSEYFENKMIKKIFKAVKGFYNKFHDIPTWEQIRVLIVGKKSPEFYDENENFKIEEFRTIIDHDVNLYDSEWIDTQFTTWLKFKSLDDSILSSIQLLKSTNVDSSNIDILVSKIVERIQNKNNISLDLNLGSDFSDIEKHITLVSNRKKTGIDFFDKCLAGGVGPGELVIFAGAPKSGKSTFMTNFACKSMLQGQNTVIVSFEMNEPTYIKRCACNLFNMTSAEYDTIVAEEDKYSLKSVMKQLYKKDEDFLKFPGQLIIKAFPTSSASVRDVEAYLKKLQDVKNMKIDLVVLDYVNIMENYRNKNSENTYIKVKQICEDVRGMCHRLQVGVISGTQLNQEGRVGESYGLKSHVMDCLKFCPVI